MEKEFEIFMVSIEWNKPNHYKSLVKGKRPLEYSFNEDKRIYEYDLVLYHKEESKYFQFAIKSSQTPYLEMINEGEKHHSKLYNIERDWWIIKGDWRIGARGMGYHHCPSVNTQGKIKIVISNNDSIINNTIELDINSPIEGFDFERLKNDFEGELWNLITLNSSKVNTEKVEVKWGDKIFRFAESHLIIAFLQEFDKILKNPKKELIYTVKNLPLVKVKPIPATYRKIAISGVSGNLPSKSFTENFDNYENRFLCLMLYKIFQIINYNNRFSNQQLNRLRSEIDNIEKKIVELQKPQTVSKQRIVSQIKAQESFYDSWLRNWYINKDLVLRKCNNDNCRVTMIVEIVYQSDNYDYWLKKDGDYCLMSFPTPMNSIFEPQKSQRLRIKAFCYKSGSAGSYPKYKVKAIESIELLSINYKSVIDRQKRNYEVLKENNWQLSSILNHREQSKLELERNNQIATLRKRIKKIEVQNNSLKNFSKELQQLDPILKKYVFSEFVKGISFRKLTRFQPSMTYIQNIHYRNAYSYYKEILKSEGIDVDVFDLYEEVTDYGIREMPQVFELWSLVMIIKCLEENYGFRHDLKSMKTLLKNISPNVKKIQNHFVINFVGNIKGREVTLHYQKQLSNGKRPDFVLEITHGSRTSHIILDSKFKNYNYKLSVTYDAKDLVDKYIIGSNYFVFILHPCEDKHHNNFLSRLTNFGGDRIFFDDQVSFPFHKYGYLKIKPGDVDNIKKTIGMAFEYLIEPSYNAKQPDRNIDPKPVYEMVCLSCGVGNINLNRQARGANRYYYICKCDNKDCGHDIYIDYCWNCKTKLFKHGSYWDYHKTSVWSIFDIHCPSCGMTAADRPG